MQSDPVLTIEEVADLCGVSRRTVDRWVATDGDDRLESMLIGLGATRIVRPEVLAEFAEQRTMLLMGDPHKVARPWPRAVSTAATGDA